MLPIPFADTTLRFAFDQQQALDALNTWGGRPLPIAASAWHDGALHVRLSGAEALRAACAQLGGETVAESESAALWQALREQSHAFSPLSPLAAPCGASPCRHRRATRPCPARNCGMGRRAALVAGRR